MDRDPLQEDGFAVQQNLLVASFDSTETYLIFDSSGIERDMNLIEFGILRAPKLQLLCCNLKCCAYLSIFISSKLLLELQFWNKDTNFVTSLLGIQLGRESYFSNLGLISCILQLQIVILKINCWHIY